MYSTCLERQDAAIVAESDFSLPLAASQYAAQGWPIFAVAPGGKVPITAHGVKDATTNPKVITTWWDETPDANIGFATGVPSGIYVVDVDGEEGERTLLDLQRKRAPLPVTVCVRTKSGWHFFYSHHGQSLPNTARRLGPGLDTRGTGGYVILPPSIHPSGQRYYWYDPECPIAELSSWVVELWVPPRIERPPSRPIKAVDRYVEAAVERELEAVRSAPNGARNHTLNSASFALGSFVGAGVLDQTSIERSLVDAALAAGLDEHESLRTVASGLSGGKRNPRGTPT